MLDSSSLLILAEEPQRAPGFEAMLVFFVPMMILFYFMVLRPAANERKKHDELLKGLKKNDRVVTTSGIIGQVVTVSTDGKEVTLKVDDNVRLKFLRSAIAGVMNEDKKDESAPAKT